MFDRASPGISSGFGSYGFRPGTLGVLAIVHYVQAAPAFGSMRPMAKRGTVPVVSPEMSIAALEKQRACTCRRRRN